MTGLSEAEVAGYQRDGVLVPDCRLPEGRLSELRETLDRVLAENPGVRPEQLVSVHIEGRNPEGVRGSEAFLELARDPALLDMVAQLIGDDIILWGCHLFCKPAGDGMEVPWHQDGHYWPIRPLATCTLWLALDDSTVENGCLRVIPGCHRDQRLYNHLTEDREGLALTRQIDSEVFDQADALDVELEAGQMSMHDVYMIHGSNPNRSTKRRAGVAIRYMPATSHFDRDMYRPGVANGFLVDYASRPLWLLRGIDCSGKNDFTIGHGAAR